MAGPAQQANNIRTRLVASHGKTSRPSPLTEIIGMLRFVTIAGASVAFIVALAPPVPDGPTSPRCTLVPSVILTANQAAFTCVLFVLFWKARVKVRVVALVISPVV